MEILPESPTTTCSHCEKSILTRNIELHYAHCSRNLEKCRICGDMVSRKHANEHFLNTHAPVACSLCSETVERGVLAHHKGENCPQRIVTCEYCDFPLPAVDLFKHKEFCGNRTEYCDLCNKYVRLCERADHEIQLHNSPDAVLESVFGDDSITVNRGQGVGAPRGLHNGSSWKHTLFKIAITGIAVLVGSIILHKRSESAQQER